MIVNSETLNTLTFTFKAVVSVILSANLEMMPNHFYKIVNLQLTETQSFNHNRQSVIWMQSIRTTDNNKPDKWENGYIDTYHI